MNNLFYTTNVSTSVLTLSDQEATHCALVLRKKVGDIIYVIDGQGNRYKCGIDSLSKREVDCTILSTEFKERTERVSIAIAPTKNRDRLEWMIEKIVEIGVSSIILMNTANMERSRTNMERLRKKMVSAVKQSLRFYIPEIKEMNYRDVLEIEADNRYIAHCFPDMEKNSKGRVRSETPLDHCLILIGPEGDFTTQEVEQAFEAGFQGLDLGEYRLRTETAAIVAVARFQ